MANFAVAASAETIERANRVMEVYAQEGDKKEDILVRILAVAEAEATKGTHPELAGDLKAIDETIATLIRQINGVVAGQDSQINDLKGRINTAIEEKNGALGEAAKMIEEAHSIQAAAEITVQELKKTVDTIKEQAQKEVDQAKHEAEQALRERDDARTIAAEKSANNDLLSRRVAELEAEVKNYKNLQEEVKKLADEIQKKESQLKDAAHALKMAESQAVIEKERAVMDKEREMLERIGETNKENARLQAQIEQLQPAKRPARKTATQKE